MLHAGNSVPGVAYSQPTAAGWQRLSVDNQVAVCSGMVTLVAPKSSVIDLSPLSKGLEVTSTAHFFQGSRHEVDRV